MRLIVQRVEKGKVTLKETGIVSGEIQNGLFVLVGIHEDDTNEKADELAKKLINLRILSDNDGKMNMSVLDTKQSVLIVSQFTLYADTKSGNRPSFIKAAHAEIAKPIYEYFIELLKKDGVHVQTGSFGEYMEIETVLDGPVTIILEA